MPIQVTRALDWVTNRVGDFDRNTWIVIGVGLTVFAFVSMRGFGSRSNY
jgi:hypothetical protein